MADHYTSRREDLMALPSTVTSKGQHQNAMLKPVLHAPNSDSDTDTGDGSMLDTDSEAGSDSDTESHADSTAFTCQSNTDDHYEDSLSNTYGDTSTDIQPRTEGDLHIHSVLDCGCDVMVCQFNDEGTILAVGLSNGTIKVYSIDSGSLVKTLRDSDIILSPLPVTALRFFVSARSHSLLLATYASGIVRCWYVWGQECIWELKDVGESSGWKEGQRQTLSLSLSSSGETAATGGSDSAIHLYDVHTHQRLLTCSASANRSVMDGHRFRVFAVNFHPDRETEFISGGWDNSIQVCTLCNYIH
ncbi:hypothetical protein JZ751_026368 [Albula glossodonta]|uniref:Anaphase-promoting complex subunit 4 WD40 domain-containing protein n=1 Tax=Albula glossodonta TaxID=121402 RepID=A0A8T2PBW3_9TELE|nr:hypothetical protein JZ751_026368 [Albula glossodonta]